MTLSAHIDTFARDHLPPAEQQPDYLFDRPELQFPEQLNCASELLDRWVENGQGGRLCIQGQGQRWTYADLQREANAIAQVLVQDMGLVPGNRVLLRGANSPRLAACWFAVVKAGGIAVGSMPLLRAKELTQIVHKAEVSHALCDARLADELALALPLCPTLKQVLHFNSTEPTGLDARAASKPAHFDTVKTGRDDTCSIAFTFGLGGLLLFPLAVGASTVLLERASPDALPAAIAQYRATVCVTAPTSYRAMAPYLKQHDVSSLRKCVSAGEALPAATRQLWKAASGIEMIDGIGSTELLHIFISHDEAHARPGATGTPVPGYQACVLDDTGKPVPPGQVGRLAVKGPTGCRYLTVPGDERQRQYVHNGWNVTGDAYLMDADGYFVYQARTDDMIISGGYNIAGPEVEAALLLHEQVAECGVIGVADDERGQIVQAYVVLRPGAVTSASLAGELQDFVKRSIAPYKYPRAIQFCDALPRTETGKLQRFRLRDLPTATSSTP